MWLLFFLYTILLGLYFLSFFPKDLPFLIKISLVYLLGTLFLTALFFVSYPLLAISSIFLYLPFLILIPVFYLSYFVILSEAKDLLRMQENFSNKLRDSSSHLARLRMTIKRNLGEILVLLFSLSFSSFLFFKTIWFNFKTGQTLIAGKLWSDFSAHIPLINSFSIGFNFPPQYPLFPGEPIRYYFLFDFQIAMLEKLGLPLFLAVNLPSILSFTILLLLIYCTAVLLFKRRLAGILTIILTLFNSSWAFLSLLRKVPFAGNLLLWVSQIIGRKEFLAFGPYDGGIVTAFWNLNVYTNQRHFAFALSLLFLIIYLFFSGPLENRKGLFLLGATIGLLPVVHSGVFLITILSLPVLLLKNRSFFLSHLGNLSNLGYLILPIIFLSLPQLLYMQGTPSSLPEAGLKFRPGYLTFVNFNWTAFLKFWLFNLGLTAFLAPLGFLLAPKKARLLFLLAPLPFLIGNLFSFSPDMATNHKFFNFSVIILNFYSAYVITRLLSLRGATPSLSRGSDVAISTENRLPRHSLRSWLAMTSGLVLFFFLTLSGLLDFFPVFNDNFFGVPDLNQKTDIALIEQNTNPKSVFANSYYLYHPASLAGRAVVLGWPYFSWSAGYNTNARDKQQRELYSSNNVTKTCSLIKTLQVDYVTLSTQIKDESTNFNLDFWLKNFPLVYQNQRSGFFIFSAASCPFRFRGNDIKAYLVYNLGYVS